MWAACARLACRVPLDVILTNRPNIHQTLKKTDRSDIEMSQSIIYDNLPAADGAMARPAQARGARRTFLLWGGRSRKPRRSRPRGFILPGPRAGSPWWPAG